MHADESDQRQRLAHNLPSYEQRLEAGVVTLATACRKNPLHELERFRWCKERLSIHVEGPQEGTGFDGFMGGVMARLPPPFQLHVHLGGGRAGGYGYMTSGRPGTSLPLNLRALLEGVLKIQLESGGAPADARLVSDLVKLSYPSLSALADFAPTAPVFLVSVIPKPERGYRLKVYYNIRLGHPSGHQEALGRMLDRMGLLRPGFVEALYQNVYVDDVRLPGVGVEIDGAGRYGALIFFLVPYEHLPLLPARLEPLCGGRVSRQELESQVASVRAMVQTMGREAFGTHLELAVCLHTRRPINFFYSAVLGGEDTPQLLPRLERYLDGVGLPKKPLLDTIGVLSRGTVRGAVAKQTLNALAQMPIGGGRQPHLLCSMQPVL